MKTINTSVPTPNSGIGGRRSSDIGGGGGGAAAKGRMRLD